MNLQDQFLNQARKEKIPLTIFLVNGFQLRVVVKAFDNFTIHLVDADGRQNILYKHAISTIVPSRPVVFGERAEDDPEDNED